MKKNVLGFILVIVGSVVLFGNLGYLSGHFTLLGIGAVFLFFYFLSGKSRESRKVGFLIPGLIVTAIGTHAILSASFKAVATNEYLFFVLLGFAFMGIYLIHTSKDPGGRWPLFPALGLFGFSAFLVAVKFFDSKVVNTVMNNLFPIVIICIGLFLIVKSSLKKGD